MPGRRASIASSGDKQQDAIRLLLQTVRRTVSRLIEDLWVDVRVTNSFSYISVHSQLQDPAITAIASRSFLPGRNTPGKDVETLGWTFAFRLTWTDKQIASSGDAQRDGYYFKLCDIQSRA